jgi:hypothetical protein
MTLVTLPVSGIHATTKLRTSNTAVIPAKAGIHFDSVGYFENQDGFPLSRE